jgi:hypothetical protein
MDLGATDVLVDVQRGPPPALAWFAGLTDLPAFPGFVVMEDLWRQPGFWVYQLGSHRCVW